MQKLRAANPDAMFLAGVLTAENVLIFRAYRELRQRGELSAAGWLRSLGEAPLVHDVFAWTDPAPFVRHSLQQVMMRLPRLGARMLRWLYSAS